MSVTKCSVPRVRLLLALALASLVAAAAAQAAGEPEVFGSAKLGSLSVTSGVLVGPTGVDLRGVWVDEKRPCSENRTLTIRAEVDYVPTGKRVVRRGSFKTANCAEGGPNMGWTITAKAAGFACPNGAWRPGRYHFVTTTVETKSKLRAVASVGWVRQGRC